MLPYISAIQSNGILQFIINNITSYKKENEPLLQTTNQNIDIQKVYEMFFNIQQMIVNVNTKIDNIKTIKIFTSNTFDTIKLSQSENTKNKSDNNFSTSF
jgi:hypothetical protein